MFGRTNPVIRTVIGIALVVIGVALHKLLLGVAGGVVLVVTGAQVLAGAKRGGGLRR